ncbi:proline-rich protein 14 isoform 2-T2 [Discoglossus pictus]
MLLSSFSPDECPSTPSIKQRNKLEAQTVLSPTAHSECAVRKRLLRDCASPLEKERKKILAVELRDVSKTEDLYMRSQLTESPSHEECLSTHSPLRRAELRPQESISHDGRPMCGMKRRRLRECALGLKASPLERQNEKILAVELADMSKEVQVLFEKSPLAERKTICEDQTPEKRPSCMDGSILIPPISVPSVDSSLAAPSSHSPMSLEFSQHQPSHISDLKNISLLSSLPSKSNMLPKLQGWGLTPFLNSVRSKLESFADIFLTPIKVLRDPGDQDVHDTSQADRMDSSESLYEPEEGSSPRDHCTLEAPAQTAHATENRKDGGSNVVPCSSPSHAKGEGYTSTASTGGLQKGTVEGNTSVSVGVYSEHNNPPGPSMPGTGMNIQLKIAISSPPATLCRPPLQRCLSCPSMPLTPTLPFRCAVASPRQRRHSLGTVEENEVLTRIAFPFTCLRKEKHPHLLCSGGTPLTHYHPNLFSASSPGICPHPNLGSVTSPETSHQQRGFVNASGFSPSSSISLHGMRRPHHHSPEHRNIECTSEDASLFDSELKEPENWHRPNAGKVSNFQIRKRPTRQEGNLTPLGLPKRARLQKEEFSLEEIYTNKNYRTPTEKRTFETIFEEPLLKGGSLVLTSQRPLRRLIVFREGNAPPRRRNKKKKRGVRSRRGTQINIEEKIDLDVLLQDKLSQLEAALQREQGDN